MFFLFFWRAYWDTVWNKFEGSRLDGAFEMQNNINNVGDPGYGARAAVRMPLVTGAPLLLMGSPIDMQGRNLI